MRTGFGERVVSVGTGPATNWFVGTPEGAAATIVDRAASRRGGYVCLANAHVAATAARAPAVEAAVGGAWLVLPDGAPLAWLLRRRFPRARRIAGADLLPIVMRRGVERSLRHVLLGSDDETLGRLRAALEARDPDIAIVGAFAPPFSDVDAIATSRAVERIRSLEPHIVWCALGAPKQELFMHQYGDRLFPSLLIGVGAAFDFLAGTKKRAPVWMQRAGLEWLHRLASEPRRLGSRYAVTNTFFVISAARELARRRRSTDVALDA